jgi:glucose-6-phosphate 1-dehydrogenase
MIGTLVIFGASGDLTKRLLLPGFGQLLDSGRGRELQLIGVGVDPMTDAAWRQRVADSFKAGGASGSVSHAVVAKARYLQADVTNPDDLKKIIGECAGTPALYFALPPRITIATCHALAKVTLPPGTVFGMEKPFGTDLHTAIALNRQVTTLIPERNIHRVDHFLGKSTVLNLLGLRFANRIFEQVWNADNVAKIEITFDEELALEGRAGYYDKAGALIDMVQSHLLLVLALVAMEPPSSLDADDLRGAMAQALRATRVWGGDAATASRRARYTAGTIDGRRLPAYVKEKGVNPALGTETLTEVTLAVENWRWAGVPFVLRSGKALADKRQDVVVTFKDVPHLPHGFAGRPGPSQLRLSLNPDGMQLDLSINGEGNPFDLDRVTLEAEFANGALPPYGEVLAGLLDDDPTLSVRADEVEECWRIVAPILAAWKKDRVPLDSYRAGSDGPASWNSTRKRTRKA